MKNYKVILEEIEQLKLAADRLAGLTPNDDVIVELDVLTCVRKAAEEINAALERVDN